MITVQSIIKTENSVSGSERQWECGRMWESMSVSVGESTSVGVCRRECEWKRVWERVSVGVWEKEREREWE